MGNFKITYAHAKLLDQKDYFAIPVQIDVCYMSYFLPELLHLCHGELCYSYDGVLGSDW
jgi:hypothetical protein